MKRYFKRLLFSLWYFRNPPWDTGLTPPEVHDFIAQHPPGRALDFGCGTGTNAVTLAQKNWQVTGIDFAWPAIIAARRKARRAKVEIDFIVGDVSRDIPPGSKFNLLLDIGCLHNLSTDSKLRYIHSLPTLLAPGGSFLMYSFIKQPDDGSSGLTPGEIALIKTHLVLQKKVVGTDRGTRTSAWFTFQLPK